jgi:hypothetical protein
MRTKRVLFLSGLAAAASAISAAAALGSPPGTGYDWAQPGCAPAKTCCTQPSFALGYFVLNAPAADYAWAQPGTAPVTTPHAEPAIE